MTTFVHVDQPLEHAGVVRAEAVFGQLQQARKRFDGARGLAALMLGAVISALLVIADRVVVNLTDGGLVVAWIVLWALAFVALALLADTARSAARHTLAWWQRGAERRAVARADAQFMAYAQFDPRVMHELQAAVTRHDIRNAEPAVPAQAALAAASGTNVPSLHAAVRRVRTAYYY